MKDLTPIAEGDVVLKRRERGEGAVPQQGRVGLATEEFMAQKRERYEKCLPVAADILEDARAALAVRFRFLDRALWRMPLEASFDLHGLASDGVKLYYDPEYVVARFKLAPSEVVRDVVHCLFHCIFRHPFMLYSVLRQPWDVACDIAIEALLLDLVGEEFPCNMDRRAREALKVIRAHVDGVVTAERLYRFFSNEGNRIDLRSLAPMFYRDTHGLWYADEGTDPTQGAQGAACQQAEDREGGRMPATGGSESLDDTCGAGEAPCARGRRRRGRARPGRPRRARRRRRRRRGRARRCRRPARRRRRAAGRRRGVGGHRPAHPDRAGIPDAAPGRGRGRFRSGACGREPRKARLRRLPGALRHAARTHAR